MKKYNSDVPKRILQRFWSWWTSKPGAGRAGGETTTTDESPISTTTTTIITTTLETTNFDSTDPPEVVVRNLNHSRRSISASINHGAVWVPANHALFQIANVCFLISFLAPHTRNGLFLLRGGLVLGCFFMILWAAIVVRFVDAIVWNILFLLANLGHLLYQLYKIRPIKFQKEIEDVYQDLFAPLHLPRHQYQRVMNCPPSVQYFKNNELYAKETVTKVETLTLVLSGKFVVSQNDHVLYYVIPRQFIDSPEWFGISSSNTFQVSIMAIEDSRVLVWRRDDLKKTMMSDSYTLATFDHILGRDVVKKLLQVNESVATDSIKASPIKRKSWGKTEVSSQAFMSRPGEGSGVTAVLIKQLQGNHPNMYHLSHMDKKNRHGYN